MPEETDWARFKREVSAEQRDELAYRMYQWEARQGTHGPDCWKWGPSHYSCLLRFAGLRTEDDGGSNAQT